MIPGPLEFRTDDENSTIGVIAASGPSTEIAVPSHKTASVSRISSNDGSADAARVSHEAVLTSGETFSASAGSR